jgi:PKD repeat protein
MGIPCTLPFQQFIVQSITRLRTPLIQFVKAAGNPTANFDYAPTDIFANQKVTFDASTSYDPDGAITKYNWDFGDGTKVAGVIVMHSYTAQGKYNVVLTVTDDAGLTNSKSNEITVEETENAIYVPDDYTTIVHATKSDDHVFEVTVDYVTISRFTVKGATENPNAGICLHYADYCNISGFCGNKRRNDTANI